MIEPIPITWSLIVQIALMIMGLWAFYKVIKEILQNVTARHDKEQKWDEYEKNLKLERDKIYEKYDVKLAEIKREMEANEEVAKKERELIKENYNDKLTELENKIDYNHCEMDAKTQELKSEITLLTKGMAAVLDGLVQQNCNGPVKKAKEEFESYLISKI